MVAAGFIVLLLGVITFGHYQNKTYAAGNNPSITLNWINQCTIGGKITINANGQSVTKDLQFSMTSNCADRYKSGSDSYVYQDKHRCATDSNADSDIWASPWAGYHDNKYAIVKGNINYIAPGVNSACQTRWITSSSAIKIGQNGNADILYSFTSSDQKTISRVDGDSKYVFNQSSQDKSLYTQSKSLPGNGGCKDMIQITGSGSAKYWPLQAASGGTLGNAPAELKTSGCRVVDPNSTDSWDAGVNGGDSEGTLSEHAVNTKQGYYPIHLGGVVNASDGASGVGGSQTGSTGGTDSGAGTSRCYSEGGAFAWFTCELVSTIGSIEDSLIGIVNSMLETPTINFNNLTSGQSDMLKVWSTFRIMGNVVLIIAVLVIVYAEAVGGSIADAYTVRKTLPRILIAAILINLSIYIMLGLEDIANVLGGGIHNLILMPFKTLGESAIKVGGAVGNTVGISVGLGAIGVILGLGGALIPIILMLGLSSLLALLGVLITVILRQGILALLVVTSPVAFALYCLPNTEQYFKKWWDLLIKTLLVYPIVNIIIAVAWASGFIMSQVVQGKFSQIIGIVASIIPLFLIPFAFKMSGGIMASAYGAISGATNRLRKPLNAFNAKYARGQASQKWQDTLSGNRFAGGTENNRRGRINRRLQTGALLTKSGGNPLKWGERLNTERSKRTAFDRAQAEKENPELEILGKNDTLAAIAAETTDRATFEERAREINAARIGQNKPPLFQNPDELRQLSGRYESLRRSMGNDSFRQAMTMKAIAGGTHYEGPGQITAAIARAAGDDNIAMESMVGEALGLSKNAGRMDYGGSSFGSAISEARNLRDVLRNGGNIDQAIESATESIVESALESSPPGQAVYGKESSAKLLAEGRVRRLHRKIERLKEIDAAMKSGTPIDLGEKGTGVPDSTDFENAQRDAKYELAEIAGVYDAMAQASPVNARAYADGLIRVTFDVDGGTYRVLDAIERNRSDPMFTEMRREYASRTLAEANATASRAPGASTPPAPPTF